MYEAQVENCYSSSKKANVDSSGLGLNSGDGFLCALTCSSCRDEKPKRDHGSHAFAESKPLHTTAQHDLSSRFRWRGGRAGVVGQMMGKPGYYEVTAYDCQAKEGQPSSLPVCRRFTHSSAHALVAQRTLALPPPPQQQHQHQQQQQQSSSSLTCCLSAQTLAWPHTKTANSRSSNSFTPRLGKSPETRIVERARLFRARKGRRRASPAIRCQT